MRFRKPWLLVTYSCGFILVVLTNPFAFIDAPLVPCEAYSTAVLLSFPLMAWPITVRLLLWRARIRYNYQVALSISRFGLYEVGSQAEAFENYRFRASTRFGVILTIGVLGAYLVGIIAFVFVNVCFDCKGSVSLDTVHLVYFLTSTLFLLVAASLLYLYREIPDSYGLHRESVISISVTGIVIVPSLFLLRFDIGGFREQSPVLFSWVSKV